MLSKEYLHAERNQPWREALRKTIKNKERTDLFTFVLKDEHWTLDKWSTIWSKTGSADDFIWPYYR